VATANDIKKRLEENWVEFLNINSSKLVSETLEGATPPSVFIGRYGYPKVKVGPMVPPLHGDTTLLDRPEMWLGKGLEDIVKYRLSLVRGVSDVNICVTSGRYIESLQELAMASKSAESEAMFEKRPITDIEQKKELGESAPFGPIAPLKSFKTASLSVDRRIEKAYYDKDLHAAEAIVDLYKKEVEVSRIHRVLSIGMLGLQKNRRLVPTRWSISATDDIISASLIKSVASNIQIDFFEVYKYSHLGNYYSVILIPDKVWSFEMKEVWIDDNGNLGMGLDFEDARGLNHYPVIAGAYFAARLGVAEYLSKRRRKAAALVLREIHSDYVMPVGVWQVREGIREALKSGKRLFEGFERALSFASMNLFVPKEEWIRGSKIFEYKKKQLRMTDFTGNSKYEE
jgi:DNA repair protein NreA